MDTMDKIKIIFFDIDGTLIDKNKKKISPRTLSTLARLKENNFIICIATGRAPLEIPKFEGVDIDAFLAFNGSYCYHSNQVIFSNSITNEDVHTIIKNAASIKRPLSIATNERIASNGTDEDLVEYFSFAGMEVEVAEDFEEFANHEIYQIMLGCREKDHLQLLKDVQHARITSWWDRAVDIIPDNGGKGVGVEKLLEFYHLDKSEAMAFGDGDNDLEMFQVVGKSIAMGNASENLKAIADEICGNVEDDGIYHYCMRHHLI